MSTAEYITTRRTTVTKRTAPSAKPLPATNLRKPASKPKTAKKPVLIEGSFFAVTAHDAQGLWGFHGELPADLVRAMLEVYQRATK